MKATPFRAVVNRPTLRTAGAVHLTILRFVEGACDGPTRSVVTSAHTAAVTRCLGAEDVATASTLVWQNTIYGQESTNNP